MRRWIYCVLTLILCIFGITEISTLLPVFAAEEGKTYDLTEDFFEADIDLKINGTTHNGEGMQIRTGDSFTFTMNYILPDDKTFSAKDTFTYVLPKDLNIRSQSQKPIYQPGTTSEVGTFVIEDYTIKIKYKQEFLNMQQKDSGVMLEGEINIQEDSINDEGMVCIELPGMESIIYPWYDGTGFEVSKEITDNEVKIETDESGNRKAYIEYKIKIKSLVDNYNVKIVDDFDYRYPDYSSGAFSSWNDTYYSSQPGSTIEIIKGEVTNLRSAPTSGYVDNEYMSYKWLWRADYMEAGSEATITYKYYITKASTLYLDDGLTLTNSYEYRNTVAVKGNNSKDITSPTKISWNPARVWKKANVDMTKKEIKFTLCAMPGDWNNAKLTDELGYNNSLKYMNIEDTAEVEVWKDGGQADSITWKELVEGYVIDKDDAKYYEFKYTIKVQELVDNTVPSYLYNDGWFKEWNIRYRWEYDWIKGVYGFRINKYSILREKDHEIDWYIEFSLNSDLGYACKIYDSLDNIKYQWIVPNSWYMQYKAPGDTTSWTDLEKLTDLSSIGAEWIEPVKFTFTDWEDNTDQRIKRIDAKFDNGLKAGTYRLYVTTKYDYKKLLINSVGSGAWSMYNYGYFGMDGYSLYKSDYSSVYPDGIIKGPQYGSSTSAGSYQNLDTIKWYIQYNNNNMPWEGKDLNKNYIVDVLSTGQKFKRAYYYETVDGKSTQIEVEPCEAPEGYETENRVYFRMSDLPLVSKGNNYKTLYIETTITDYFEWTGKTKVENNCYCIFDDVVSKAVSAYLWADPYKAIQKVAEYTKATAPLVNYTVTLNPGGVQLLPKDTEDGYLEVQDTFGAALGFVPSTLGYATKDEKGNWSNYSPWTDFETSGQTITIKNVPDKTPIKFQYSCTVKLETGSTLDVSNAQNAIALKGIAFTNSSSSATVQSAVLDSAVHASSNTWNVIICKQNPEKEPIPNTTFEIYSYGSNSTPSDTPILEHTLTTNEKGETEEVVLYQDTIYRIKEKAPAPGYEGGFDTGLFVRPGKYPPEGGYDSSIKSYDGYLSYTFMVENEHIKRNVNVSKIWNDNNNESNLRDDATEIEIELLANNIPTGETVLLNKDNNWSATFENIHKFDKDAKEISYRVRENNLDPNYTPTITGNMVEGYEITNTELINEIKGKKIWEDSDNQDGIRPDSIFILLLQNGTEYKKQEISKETNWEYSFKNLPKYDLSGALYTYTVDEEPADEPTDEPAEEPADEFPLTPRVLQPEHGILGYERTYQETNAYNIINTHNPKTINISVDKVWIDNNNQTGIRPERIEVYLYKKIHKEDKAYVVAENNSYTDENATNSSCANNPEYELIDTKELSKENDWKTEFIDLPEYEKGQAIHYVVKEQEVEGYTSTSLITETRGLPAFKEDQSEIECTFINQANYLPYIVGTKVWDDENNKHNTRPEQIKINLLANGEIIDTTNASEENDWQYKFKMQPATDETGEVIDYTIQEEVPEGYEVEYFDLTPININSPTIKGSIMMNHEVPNEKPDIKPGLIPNEEKTGIYTYDWVCFGGTSLLGLLTLFVLKRKNA